MGALRIRATANEVGSHCESSTLVSGVSWIKKALPRLTERKNAMIINSR
jgi:hypothetical protein